MKLENIDGSRGSTLVLFNVHIHALVHTFRFPFTIVSS